MAQPKKKTSHMKQHSRRAKWKAEETTLVRCPNCAQMARPHTACTECGYYRGRPVSRRDWLVNQ